MEPEKHGYSRSKRGTSSDAFDDLKKAKDSVSKRDDLLGASGGQGGEITSEGQSLIFALITGLVGLISFELVYTSKGGFKGRVNADVKTKAKK